VPPEEILPSVHPGLGSHPYETGTSFRVWAPFAEAVFVAGDFNGWNNAAHPLAPEGDGYWSRDLEGVGDRALYKYVVVRGAERLWKNDPYAREVTSSAGDSVVRRLAFTWDGEEGYRTPPWHEMVIYEMHAGTFNDVAGGGPGTFDDVILKLDYLQELGINAIKVLPAAEFPMGQSLGYNPANLFAIEREYGGPDGFQRFVHAAHLRGIAVLLDVVYNHLGPGDLDLKRFDGWSDERHPDGIYFYDTGRIETPWAAPRPDYGRPEVRRFLRDNALFWLDELRVDGLRFDATSYIRTVDNDWRQIPDGWRLLQEINAEVDRRFPWKLTVAEDMQDDPALTRPTSGQGAGFDTQWDALFVHTVRGVLTQTEDAGRSLGDIAAMLHHRFDGDPLRRVIFTESHDEVLLKNGKRRLTEDIWPGQAESYFSRKRSALGAALVMTAPGIPMIFQGQEFLEDGAFDDAVPLDWSRRDHYAGIVRLYGDLIRLRRNFSDSTRGLRGPHVHVFHQNDADKVIAFHRWENGGPRDDVIVVLNFADRAYSSYRLGFPRGGRWRVRLNSDWQGYDPGFHGQESFDADTVPEGMDGLSHSAAIGLGPYAAVVLSQDD
jgi:1,4-alpha-glucan branching enzyme